MHHIDAKGTTVIPTEQAAKSASRSKIGLFALLGDLLHLRGSTAPKISQGSCAPSSRLALATLAALAAGFGALAFTTVPAQAAITHKYESQESSAGFKPFNEAGGVAVDESTSLTDWARGDVYEISAGAIDVFEPEAGGKRKLVAKLTGTSPGNPFEYLASIAVNDTNGDLIVEHYDGAYVLTIFEPTLFGEYAVVATLTGPNGGEFIASAVDESTGEIYALEHQNSGDYVDEFSSTGVLLDQISGTSAGSFGPSITSASVEPISQDLYVLDPELSTVYIFGPDLTIPDVTTGAVSHLTGESATLTGTVNPDRAGAATCEFEWGTSTSYGQRAKCEGPGSEATPIPGAAGEDSPVPVRSVKLTGLSADTVYHYRLAATNLADKQTNTGLGKEDLGEFTTAGLEPQPGSVSAVTAESATFNATIRPGEEPTTYYFQYGASPSYGSDAPVLSAAAPYGEPASGEGAVEVTPQPIQGLSADTVYHYRVVEVIKSAGGVEEFDSPDQTFTTQAAGSAFTLPDGRQWEMVSPPDKHGARIQQLYGYAAGVGQAAAGGGAITYLTTTPTESEAQGYSNLVQVLSTRRVGGASSWSSRDITPPHASATGANIGGLGEEYRFFSEDLSQAVLQPAGPFLPCVTAQGAAQPCLSPDASEQTPFLHDLQTGVFTPLLTGCPAAGQPCPRGVEEHADVPPGTVIADEALERERAETILLMYGPHFRGATPDLSHILLQSAEKNPVPLTETTPVAGEGGLYEYSAGRLALVSVLPEGIPAQRNELALGELGGDAFLSARHAISEDGSRVVFSTINSLETSPRTHLYLRVNAMQPQSPIEAGKCSVPSDACTVQLDSGLSGSALFQTANSDVSEVFFTDGGDLYEYDVERGELLALTEGAEVQGSVLGASEDGSYLYFVAKGKLAEGAMSGQPNLYLLHDAATRLVAVLSGEDGHDWEPQLENMPARVAPDGEWLAFMSQRPLTGYDNFDAASGKPDQEVYLYHAGTGALSCASCNPTGARPLGKEFRLSGLNGSTVEEEGTWVAGSVPGWLDYEHDGAIYQPRYLSDSGRLFFDSPDALVPLDVNGTQDVYEYEPEGVPSESRYACSAASTTGSEVFKGAHAFEVEGVKGEEGAGCVALISSGTSSEVSRFLGASETGGDVFFMTAAQLAPQDYDSSYDVYDAHECTSESPCPTASVSPPPCDTEASCKASPTPQPSIYGLPSSATFSGPGDITSSPPPSPVKKVTKKMVKCKRGKKLNHGKCVKQKKSKTAKKAKRASNDRRTSR
jgi:hypothetical protein